MLKIIKFVLFFSVINSFGQELNTEYIELKKSLSESRTALIVEFKTDCIGGEYITIEEAEDCVYERPFYLLWSNDGKYLKRKFSNCTLFETVEMNNSDFLITVLKNINLIKGSEILPVRHKLEKSLKVHEEFIEMVIDHYCISKFIFHTPSKKIEKNINHFYLETEMLDENTPNDNYKLNQKSILNTVFELINGEIADKKNCSKKPNFNTHFHKQLN